MRAFSTVELLVVISIIAILISILNIAETMDSQKEEISKANAKATATQMLWMERMDDPNPVRGIWEWEDENGDVWVMFRESTRVHNMGDSVLP